MKLMIMNAFESALCKPSRRMYEATTLSYDKAKTLDEDVSDWTSVHPTPTRAERRAVQRLDAALPSTSAGAPTSKDSEKPITDLSLDELSHVLTMLPVVHDIAFTAPTNKLFAAAARLALLSRPFSGTVVTLDAASVYGVGVCATDGRIVTGSKDRTVKMHRGGACVQTVVTPTEWVRVAAVLPDGRFVSVSTDAAVRLCTPDGTLERTFSDGFVGVVYSVAATADGEHIVVGIGCGSKGEVRLYHIDGTLVHSFKGIPEYYKGHTRAVFCVAATCDGQHIISGAADKLVKVWSVAGKHLVSTFIGHTCPVLAVAATPDGKRVLSGSSDRTVRVWQLDGIVSERVYTKLHADAVMALVTLPDNLHALSGSCDRTVKLFNHDDGSVLRTFKHHTDTVCSLALMPDGYRFVSGSDDETACIVVHGLAPPSL